MRKMVAGTLCLALATAGPAVLSAQGTTAAKPTPTPSTTPPPIVGPVSPVDRSMLHVQVILDHLGFGPGVLDGRAGPVADRGAEGVSGGAGPAEDRVDRPRDAAGALPLSRAAADADAGADRGRRSPGRSSIRRRRTRPNRPSCSRSPIARRWRSWRRCSTPRPRCCVALNPPGTRLAAGSKVVFPNALPTSRDYDAKLPAEWRKTLSDLNVVGGAAARREDRGRQVRRRAARARRGRQADRAIQRDDGVEPRSAADRDVEDPGRRLQPAVPLQSGPVLGCEGDRREGRSCRRGRTARSAWSGSTCRRSITASTARPSPRRSAGPRATAASA